MVNNEEATLIPFLQEQRNKLVESMMEDLPEYMRINAENAAEEAIRDFYAAALDSAFQRKKPQKVSISSLKRTGNIIELPATRNFIGKKLEKMVELLKEDKYEQY